MEPQMSGPMTTADSAASGRLKVATSGKRQTLKKMIRGKKDGVGGPGFFSSIGDAVKGAAGTVAKDAGMAMGSVSNLISKVVRRKAKQAPTADTKPSSPAGTISNYYSMIDKLNNGDYNK